MKDVCERVKLMLRRKEMIARMKRIKFSMNAGVLGADYEDIMEYPDDITEEGITEELETWVWEHVSCDWEELED